MHEINLPTSVGRALLCSGVFCIFLNACTLTTTKYVDHHTSYTVDKSDSDYNWYPRYYFHGYNYYSALDAEPFKNSIQTPLKINRYAQVPYREKREMG